MDRALITVMPSNSGNRLGKNLLAVFCTHPCIAFVTITTSPSSRARRKARADADAKALSSSRRAHKVSARSRSMASRCSAGTVFNAKWPSAVSAVVGCKVSSQSNTNKGRGEDPRSPMADMRQRSCASVRSHNASPRIGGADAGTTNAVSNTVSFGASGGSSGGIFSGTSGGDKQQPTAATDGDNGTTMGDIGCASDVTRAKGSAVRGEFG
mmetsp:Transcript_62770/g.182001  ORF Transcript_62770/g.182001 Transcript_62770/m.182001 type:complete len:211 (-) Transcript_62770:16-648(-)